MNVGILGSGDVGKALARGFASRGHSVTIGSRTPEKLADFTKEHFQGAIHAASFEQTARAGELLVMATLFTGTKSALDLAGPNNFAGKVVIDATNPLRFEQGKPAALALSGEDSAGESVQRWLPGAQVVKAFNTVGNAHFVDPHFPGGPPTMFIAGNDDAAKNKVAQIAESFGWEVIDAGPIEASRHLEALAMIWIDYFIRTGTWQHAFKLLRKQ
jgi:predicted dinucleotide-binding enzyme